MRLLAALATGFFAYLAVGFATGNAPSFRRSRTHRATTGTHELWLIQAGVDLTPRQFWAGSTFVGLIGFGLAWALSGAWVVAAVPALTMGFLPRTYFSRQRSRRLAETVQAWPDGLRDLTASLQSGRSLPQAIEALAATGPPALRRAFERFTTLNQMFGTQTALEMVKEDLADPTSDRVIEVLSLAYERGGSSVTGILSDMADAVTEDLRTLEEIRTAELEQRINARAVFALPWFVLLMITIRGGPFREFYQSPAGIVTVAIGAVLSLIGLLIVARLSRNPAETRVFAAPQSQRVAS